MKGHESSYLPVPFVVESEIYRKALQICRTLNDHGYECFFVGGCVRDFLLDSFKIPIDIDIATSAKPEEVELLFPQALYVGKSFGVSIVTLGKMLFEVATFRKEGPYTDRRHPDFVSFGTRCEDAARRDFTINALYFNPLKNVIWDLTEGVEHCKNKILCAVGNPESRFDEDTLRLLRLFRFQANLGLKIDEKTFEFAQKFVNRVSSLSSERIQQEIIKFKPGKWRCFGVHHQEFVTSVVDFVPMDKNFFLVSDTFHQRFPNLAFFWVAFGAVSEWIYFESRYPFRITLHHERQLKEFLDWNLNNFLTKGRDTYRNKDSVNKGDIESKEYLCYLDFVGSWLLRLKGFYDFLTLLEFQNICCFLLSRKKNSQITESFEDKKEQANLDLLSFFGKGVNTFENQKLAEFFSINNSILGLISGTQKKSVDSNGIPVTFQSVSDSGILAKQAGHVVRTWELENQLMNIGFIQNKPFVYKQLLQMYLRLSKQEQNLNETL